jgi:hypothetical protein
MEDGSSSNPRPLWPFIVGAIVIAVMVGGFLLVRDLVAFGRPVPEFPALSEEPDPSLHGTVAYFAMDTEEKTQVNRGCVRVVAAAGAPSRDVLCISAEGHDIGPQLTFLPDGRLQVTMFSRPPDQPLVAAWQKIVDLRTGETEDVPAAQLPAAPVGLGTTVTPAGEQISATSRANTAQMVLTDADGVARTLWSADVPPDYGIEATWAPNWEWILAYDGRLLVVTLDDPARIRVLAAEAWALGETAGLDPPLAFFTVTDADLPTDED